MNAKIPTTVISGFPCIGKSTFAQLFPFIFRDLESSTYHWISVIEAGSGNEEKEKIPNPEWPKNYIDSIKALEKSGLYLTIMVSSHEDIRRAMQKAGIRYTNIFPSDTPEMKKLILDRAKKRGSPPEFIDLLEKNFSDYVKSMAEDPGATRKVALDISTINEWGTWCAYA